MDLHIVIGLLIIIILLIIFGPWLLVALGAVFVAVVAAVVWLFTKGWPFLLLGMGIAVLVGFAQLTMAQNAAPTPKRPKGRASAKEIKRALDQSIERGRDQGRTLEQIERDKRDRATMDALMRRHQEGPYKPKE
jgi:membrane protein implicated in regulation of membrane protease activity